MHPLLQSLELGDPVRALSELHAILPGLDEESRQRLEALIATSPAPSQLLHYFSTFRQRHPGEFLSLARSPFQLRAAAAVFSFSRFLSESCLEHPHWLQQFDAMDRARPVEEYTALLAALLDRESAGKPEPVLLARFRRQQILRILVRDTLGLAGLSEITEELSDLAVAILETGYRRLRDSLVARHGIPRYTAEDGSLRECGMSVIALGKLGGRELNYSSDIDLMFVYAANGETDGPHPISNKEFYKKIANQFSDLLSVYTAEGMCYRVDLRLRPDGSLGEVCLSLEGALKYYRTRARDWELQMLIKGRPVAGDRSTGRALLDAIEPLIYSSTLDFSAVEAVSVTRERIGEKLASRRGRNSGLDVKLAPGGIRDIEFLAQCLQRLHGGRVPWLRHGGTLLALARLSDKDLFSDAEHGRLASAYRFLREVEHRLQIAEDRQTHSLPGNSRDLELLARRMPRATGSPEPSAATFLQQLNAHLETVQEIYQRVIHAQRPTYYSLAPAPEISDESPAPESTRPIPTASNLVRFLDRLAPNFAAAVAQAQLKRGAAFFEHFLEKVSSTPDLLHLADSQPALAHCLLDVFEHSPFFAEQLARTPNLIEELARPLAIRSPDLEETALLQDASALRRAFRREMFRIQTASICASIPVFETLAHTSDLAASAIRAAYRMAVEQTVAVHPPAAPDYSPSNEMMVVALGRLGMREFDLCSDADLVFVLPEKDSSEHVFWTRVANHIIETLTAYTGDGQLFSVDTRLRPNGTAGPLVQTESAFKDYFAHHAEAWEGISYMKARAIAGDTEYARNFLTALQDVDWRHYGQNGRSRTVLRQMRLRLEKEQGAANPLKAGLGGYYDIDFVLLYLRLKGAGIFFDVLNTPARIDVVEKMGHLDRADAEFLRDAAIFYRSVDHGLRVYSGHAAGSLPVAESPLEALTSLVRRWTPEHLHVQPLEATLTHIRHRTRELFDRLFS